jgi:hypothetical protein
MLGNGEVARQIHWWGKDVKGVTAICDDIGDENRITINFFGRLRRVQNAESDTKDSARKFTGIPRIKGARGKG